MPTHRFQTTALTVACLSVAVAIPATAQLPNPFLLPRGALRVGFDPQWTSHRELFDTAGNRIPLGAYFSADSVGGSLLPTLTDAEAAVRSITGDAVFRFNAGRLRTQLEADRRRFPFSLSLGVSNRLTFTATVPIVVTRVKVTALIDTTTSEVGWNPASSLAPEGALDSLAALLGQLDAAAASLDAGIASGGFGCPDAPSCQEAQDLSARIRTLAGNLQMLTGYAPTSDGAGSSIPPFAPLAQSATGEAILQALADVSGELQALGEPPLAGTLPLPRDAIPANAMDAVLTNSEFGYDADSLNPAETIKLSGLGDIELGARFGLATGPTFRAVLGTLVRLPTGKKQDDPNNLVDLAPADGQLDLQVSLEGAFEPGGPLGLWFGGAYTLQLGDRITRRIASAEHPIVPAASIAVVDRNLGDVLRASIHPAVRLSPSFRVFVSAGVYHKGADRYTVGGAAVPELEALTAQTIWTVGGGVWYRLERNRRGAALPIEAGFVYDKAMFGKGGQAPRGGRMSLSLRFFYRLWGGAAPTPAEPTPEG